MGVVVGEPASDGLEGWAEFTTPVVTACNVDVCEEYEGELGVIDGDAVGSHSTCFGAKEFHVGGDFFAEVKFELDDMEELGEDVAGVWAIGALDDGGKDFFEEPVVDASKVGAVGSFEDCVGDVRTDFGGDGFGGALFGPDDGLVDEVDSVGFVLCVGAAVDGGRHDGAACGCCGGDGFGVVENGLRRGDGGRFYRSDFVGGGAEFEHPVAGVSGVVGLAEDSVDAGDECRGGVVVVLPIVCRWKGQFFDARGNMLASGGSCCEARISHVWAGFWEKKLDICGS